MSSDKKRKTNFFGRLLHLKSDKSPNLDSVSKSTQNPGEASSSKTKLTEDDTAPPSYNDSQIQIRLGPSHHEHQSSLNTEQQNPFATVLSGYQHDRSTAQSTWEACKLGLRVLKEVSEACGFLKAAVGGFLVVVDIIEVRCCAIGIEHI